MELERIGVRHGQNALVPAEHTPTVPAPTLRILVRHRFTILVTGIMCGAAVLVLSLAAPPVYQATTAIEIQAPAEEAAGMFDADGVRHSGGPADAYVQTQVEILWGRALLNYVIGKLKLDERPEFNANSGWMRRVVALFRPPPHCVTTSPSRVRILTRCCNSARYSTSARGSK